MQLETRVTATARGPVWIVDDDPRTAQVLAVLLQMDGYDANDCGSARLLERLAVAPPPAALIMSVSMGRGDAGVRLVRGRHPTLPLVVITEHPQWAQRLVPLPVVFTKPVDYPALLAALRVVLAVSS